MDGIEAEQFDAWKEYPFLEITWVKLKLPRFLTTKTISLKMYTLKTNPTHIDNASGQPLLFLTHDYEQSYSFILKPLAVF